MQPAFKTQVLPLHLLLSTSLLACGAPAGVSSLNPANIPANTPSAADLQTVSIKFTPEVNGKAFKCGESYSGVGSSSSILKPKDFRLYINGLHLLKANGEAVAVQLDQNKWQYDSLALLDFEDKSGDCQSGTSETHFEITGKLPKGEYTGLRFELGVPFEMNHQDASKAHSPLNLTSMFWVWRSGYKFTRIDFSTTGMPQGYFIHLGSTHCTGTASSMPAMSHLDAMAQQSAEHTHFQLSHEGHVEVGTELATTAPMQCEHPNRAMITLEGFKADQHTVVADLGKLLADSNLDSNQTDTAAGCMSEPGDLDCRGILPKLGVAFQELPAEQQFFALKPH